MPIIETMPRWVVHNLFARRRRINLLPDIILPIRAKPQILHSLRNSIHEEIGISISEMLSRQEEHARLLAIGIATATGAGTGTGTRIDTTIEGEEEEVVVVVDAAAIHPITPIVQPVHPITRKARMIAIIALPIEGGLLVKLLDGVDLLDPVKRMKRLWRKSRLHWRRMGNRIFSLMRNRSLLGIQPCPSTSVITLELSTRSR
jgi:hypothetical protein